MDMQEALPLFIKLTFSFFAAFSAIALWSRTRNPAWTLMVLSAVMFFIDVLYASLVMLGVASYNYLILSGFPLLRPLLSGIPYLLMTCGFLVYIFSEKRY